MTHCTPDELMDVIDGARPVASLPHMASCAVCRAQLDELRAVLADVAEAEVPEPSPHYWRQLSGQVRDAVARERLGGWRGRLPPHGPRRWAWPLGAAAALALAALTFRVSEGPTLEQRPQSASLGVSPAAPATQNVPAPGPVDRPREPSESLGSADVGDESLIVFMQDLVESFDSDAASPWLPAVAVTEAAVQELSSDERRELQRLLQEALESGA